MLGVVPKPKRKNTPLSPPPPHKVNSCLLLPQGQPTRDCQMEEIWGQPRLLLGNKQTKNKQLPPKTVLQAGRERER